MRLFKVFTIGFVLCFLVSCNGTKSKIPPPFSLSVNEGSLHLGDTLNIVLNNPKNLDISSISYLLDGLIISEKTPLNITRLGKRKLQAIVNYEDDVDTISKSITIYNNEIPAIYTYEIINTYPHDINAYTQGLEFYNGTLYESTGHKGESTLRQVDFETGMVLKNIDLEDKFFGEGLTIHNDKIYQLTWQAKMGFIYDVETFEKITTFKYGKSKEGWGICNDGKSLYKSDGTEKIWIINPDTMTENGHLEVYTEKGKIPSLNELEWINGKIFANIYQRNGVAIINPKTGGVEGVIDFKPLKNLVTQHDELDVLNGIAYNPQRQTIFVTGKNWDKLFEVKINKK